MEKVKISKKAYYVMIENASKENGYLNPVLVGEGEYLKLNDRKCIPIGLLYQIYSEGDVSLEKHFQIFTKRFFNVNCPKLDRISFAAVMYQSIMDLKLELGKNSKEIMDWLSWLYKSRYSVDESYRVELLLACLTEKYS